MAVLRLEARHVTNLGSFTRELGSCHSKMSLLLQEKLPHSFTIWALLSLGSIPLGLSNKLRLKFDVFHLNKPHFLPFSTLSCSHELIRFCIPIASVRNKTFVRLGPSAIILLTCHFILFYLSNSGYTTLLLHTTEELPSISCFVHPHICNCFISFFSPSFQ